MQHRLALGERVPAAGLGTKPYSRYYLKIAYARTWESPRSRCKPTQIKNKIKVQTCLMEGRRPGRRARQSPPAQPRGAQSPRCWRRPSGRPASAWAWRRRLLLLCRLPELTDLSREGGVQHLDRSPLVRCCLLHFHRTCPQRVGSGIQSVRASLCKGVRLAPSLEAAANKALPCH